MAEVINYSCSCNFCHGEVCRACVECHDLIEDGKHPPIVRESPANGWRYPMQVVQQCTAVYVLAVAELVTQGYPTFWRQ